MKQNAEQLYSAVQRGMQASGELSVAEQKLADRKNELIQKAISAYNSLLPERRMTERDALLFVAALAENQRLHDDLLGVEADGQRAQKKLVS